MSITASGRQGGLGRNYAKCFARKLLRWHLPVGGVTRPLFHSLYHFHVLVRAAIGWSLRFFWYEPLFRSQCRTIGGRFRMEQLPYLVGRGEIVVGSGVHFSGKPSFAFSARYSPNPKLFIGNGSFLGHNCALTIAHEVRIGDNCLIAGDVRITDFDGHPLCAQQRRAGATFTPETTLLPVIIGDDVWIGHGAIVLKGVKLGDRSIIGASAVVTRDVPADTIVAGNPARVVKSLCLETPQGA